MPDDPNTFNRGTIFSGDGEIAVLLKRLGRALGYGDASDGSGGTYVAGGSTNTTQDANVAVPSTANGIAIVGTSAKARTVSITNHGSASVELSYGTTATVGSGFAIVAAGGYFETPAPTTAAIAGISASGTNNVTAVEYL